MVAFRSRRSYVVFLEAQTNMINATKNSMNEIKSMQQPGPSVLAIFEAMLVLFAPPQYKLDWTGAHKYINNNLNRIPTMLQDFDKDSVTEEKLTRLKSILARSECQPEQMRQASPACYDVYNWLKTLAEYSTLRHQRQTKV